jgi:3',5'-cyclic AMP phosphodiesterase CpdA
MSWFLQPNPTRRHFLGAAIATVAARGAAKETRWAMLSDIHVPTDPENVYRGFKPLENIKAVLPQVLKTAPDGALVAGDLARLQGLTTDYEVLSGLLAPMTAKLPVALSLGNHDDRKNFLAAFGDLLKDRRQAVAGKQILVIETGPVRLIILDSNIQTTYVAGLLGKAQRAWLESYLAQADSTPTLLVFHHPPDDADGNLHDSDRLMKIIAPRASESAPLRALARLSLRVDQDIHLINLPSTRLQLQ